MFRKLYKNKSTILRLSISDFKMRFSGSYFGLLWAIVQPLMTILVFWFVFQVGFRAKTIKDVPFILWLISGMVPWNFFQDGWINGNSTFTSYSFLVKKVIFDIEILPIVRVTASFIMNMFFHIILIIVFLIYGKFHLFFILPLLYYNFCLYLLILSLSLITSVINIFFKDMTQILGIILQFGIWMTPIMWMENIIPKKYLWLFELNPMFYIVTGYRKTLLENNFIYSGFLHNSGIFFLKIFLFFGIGIFIYKKSKSHFADVL